MADFDTMGSEERYKFGGWLYYISEGWKDPDWWSKHMELAEATGHVLNVIFTSY